MKLPTILAHCLVLSTLLLTSLLSVDPASAQVTVGGITDGRLEVRDSDNEVAFSLDAATHRLQVGDPDNDDGGQLWVLDGESRATVRFFGDNGLLFLGDSGQDGDLQIVDSGLNTTAYLDGFSARLTLGDSNSGQPGDLWIIDNRGAPVLELIGSSGDATQLSSAEGLVKAWCRVAADGTYIDGYRCTNGTVGGMPYPHRPSLSTYEVDFTPLAPDITGRPFIVSCSAPDADACTVARARPKTGDSSALVVNTDAGQNHSFTVVVF